jgi:hypothetical protein
MLSSRTFSFTRDGLATIPDVEGPWDFIRQTNGPCAFQVFNNTNGAGRSVTYGTGINKRIRIGAKGAEDSGGWRARSMTFHRSDSMDCSIELGDSGVRQTFYRPTSNISGWSFVTSTTGPCVFTVANRDDVVQALQLGEGVVNYGTQITERIRAGATGGQDSGGWRIRSLDIRPFGSQRCSVTLGDGGKSQTFYGPQTDGFNHISAWKFIRESTGGCVCRVFNGSRFDGKQHDFREIRGGQVAVGWRIRSLRIGEPG